MGAGALAFDAGLLEHSVLNRVVGAGAINGLTSKQYVDDSQFQHTASALNQATTSSKPS